MPNVPESRAAVVSAIVRSATLHAARIVMPPVRNACAKSHSSQRCCGKPQMWPKNHFERFSGSLAMCRGCVSRAASFGRRFRVRGFQRPGRSPTLAHGREILFQPGSIGGAVTVGEAVGFLGSGAVLLRRDPLPTPHSRVICIRGQSFSFGGENAWDEHRDSASVRLVAFAVELAEVPFLKSDGDENVDRHSGGKNEVG